MQSELSQLVNKSNISANDLVSMIINEEQEQMNEQIVKANATLNLSVKRLKAKLEEVKLQEEEKNVMEL